MRDSSRLVRVISVSALIGAIILAPLSAGAARGDSVRGDYSSRTSASTRIDAQAQTSLGSGGIQAGPVTLCPRTITAAGITVNVFLPSTKGCNTPPPPVDECPNVPGTQTSTPCADEECEDEGGTWDGNSCEFPEPDEPTLDFTADPITIDEGDSSTLEWDSTDADTCTASGGWSGDKALDGSQVVSPTATTTYTLTCENEAGDVSESVTVNVRLEPEPDVPTLDFNANPTTIDEGATSTLTWDSTNADSCTASGGWSGSKAIDGSQIVSPTATTTYTLECIGEGGTTTDSVTVNVRLEPEPDVPTLDFDASPTTIDEGATSTLTWNSTDADTCTASGGWSGSKSLDGTEIVSPTATTTYMLECVGEGGTTTDSVTVNVRLAPEPTGALLITEVIYDLNNSTTSPQGSEPANEWVEVYNGTNGDINLGGYFISDATGSDVLPSVVLPAGEYAVISASSTTASFWSIPAEAVVIVLPNSIGSNGLTNTGEAVFLRDAASTTIDSVSWGTNTDAFSPSVPVVTVNSGHSIAREDDTVDTNSAGDWEVRTTPTPGE